MKNNIFSDDRLNYKDFLIIIVSWYLINLSSYYISEKDFSALLYLDNILTFAVNILSYFIFLVIIYVYFNFLYDFSLTDLGFKFEAKKIDFRALIIMSSLLTAGILLINLNLEPYSNGGFFPLHLRENFFQITYSNLPLIFFTFIALIFKAAAEQFLFNKVIFSIFDLYLPSFLAVIFSGLFASLLFLEFNPIFIYIIFLTVIVSNLIYINNDYNLANSIIFYIYFLTLYIVFIYGFEFMII